MINQIETMIQIQTEDRDRVSVFFRWILVIPVAAFLTLFAQLAHWGISSTAIVVPVVLALLIRQVYPSWILTFNHSILEFTMRIAAYAFFLTDKYPTFEARADVAVIFPDVEGGKKLNRWLPIFKWILAIPLYVVGFFYLIYAAFSVLFIWIQISVTGKAATWATDAILNTLRFWNRVFGYSALLVTDEYPSFSLK